MKKFCLVPLLAALMVFVSCQKQPTEEERKAEVERQVQDRLAAERADAEKKKLEEDRASLEAREKAIAEREAAAATTATPAEEPAVTSTEPVTEPAETTETTETRTEERSTASYGMFYEKLDPYGEWRETSEYGYVWQPREAETSRDWRPYTEGRWVYSDAGWTWISDEPFGWAAYHYGRWVRLRRIGWVWVPGDEWAPAWVSWRTSKDYVGWAPLPPEARFDRRSGIHNWADNYYDIGPEQYSFVACNDFGAEHVRRAVVPTERNITIVVDTTNVTRITFSNTTIVNEGPSYDELRSRSQRPIERYRLRRERNLDAQARVRGDELEVSVPLLTVVRDVVRPRRVKERVTEVNVDNGWTEIKDRSAAERARTKFRTEATPPSNAPPKKFVKPVETTPSATPGVTAAASPSAAASATPAKTGPTATIAPAASATPTTQAASPTPATTAAPATSATPAGSASPRMRPSMTPRSRPSPSVAATPASSPAVAATAVPSTPAASATAAASVSPKVRPSITPRSRPSPSIAASPAPSPTVATTPAATATAAPSAPSASTSPVTRITPPVRVRPSPSIPSRPIPTPSPVQRKTPPMPPNTPAATAPPAETAMTPPPTFTPPVRRPSAPPRAPLPTPATTPAPGTTPATAPSAPPVTDDRAKNRRPRPPIPGATLTPSPTTSPP